MSEEQTPIPFKLVLLGNAKGGKSAIFRNLTSCPFAEDDEGTVGASYGAKAVLVGNEEDQVKLEMWDTAGSERQLAMIPAYCRNANLFLIVVDHQDLTTQEGQEKLGYFLKMAKREGMNSKGEPPPIRIVVNKMDLKQGETEEDIKKRCNGVIRQLGLDLSEVVYYSAKEQNNKDVTTNPIIQHIQPTVLQPFLAEWKRNHPSQPVVQPLPSYSGSQSEGISLKDVGIVIGKVLVFLLLFSVLTAVGITIGGLIGAAAGIWSGPGAFLTALGGAFTGAATAWMLGILIVASTTAFLVTGVEFVLYHLFNRQKMDPSLLKGEGDPHDPRASYLSKVDVKNIIGTGPSSMAADALGTPSVPPLNAGYEKISSGKTEERAPKSQAEKVAEKVADFLKQSTGLDFKPVLRYEETPLPKEVRKPHVRVWLDNATNEETAAATAKKINDLMKDGTTIANVEKHAAGAWTIAIFPKDFDAILEVAKTTTKTPNPF